MANVRSGNSVYVDTVGLVVDGPVRLQAIVARGVGAVGNLVLQDNQGTPVNKLDIEAQNGVAPVFLLFEDFPLVFPTGLRVSVATSVRATLIVREIQG